MIFKKEYIKFYGIIKNRFGDRFNLLIDNKEYVNLSFKNKEFALKKSKSFIISCYKDFVNFKGDEIIFKFICLDEVKREDLEKRYKNKK